MYDLRTKSVYRNDIFITLTPKEYNLLLFFVSNMTTVNYYNFWLFPKKGDFYTNHYLTFKKASAEDKKEFQDTFRRLVKISLHNTNGTQFISKNPPHTARIKEILEIYPNAKFIYLVRNPYTVFESTRSFFTNTIQPLKLQDFSNEQIEEQILKVYKTMYDKYEEDKVLVPEGNLIEVKFEDIEANALYVTKQIYSSLNLPGFKASEANIVAYHYHQKGYEQNKYNYDTLTVELIVKKRQFAIAHLVYSL